MKIMRDPATLLAGTTIASLVPSASSVAAVGGALSGAASVAGALFPQKTPKQKSAEQLQAEETNAARKEAREQRSLLAGMTSTDTLMKPVGGAASGVKRSLVGV